MRGLRILVTGGAGYIGSHVVKLLDALGCRVTVLDDLSTGFRELVHWGTFVQGATGDVPLLEDLFAAGRFDAILHFAAFSQVGESVAYPMRYYQNNVGGTMVLLDTALRHGVRRFIFSSSAAVYGEPLQLPIDESHRCLPTSPYGATKLTVERLLQDCAQAHDLGFGCLRYFNAAGADPSGVIGEMHDPETHIIPRLLGVAAGLEGAFSVFGQEHDTPDGTCIRDYVHVNDLAWAHVLVLQALMDGSRGLIYNVGNSRGYSVMEVVAAARAVTGCPIPVRFEKARPGDPAVLVADCTKIKAELGWKPRYEALEMMVATAWNRHKR
ncbi:UDP-glucose 4-epimerase GalE [Desulfatitalea alkaliphila]|uniref:UDP-glucose 4-epimerase n=1 Tax=Desulfatitalea alkaliphila TaxID=2929485 RepID=A0AA41R639_9BACT|nr:UDP-glucose 4-epimerase GalE [Desulfatitalea alkaliphila]MCJ8502476.1 UDP-glucose 4-epimerase GalE [Desulfatitalea alkaliphila]